MDQNKIQLMEHQREMVDFFRMKNGRCLWYADPGVGKTFAACEVIRRCLAGRRDNTLPALVVAPAALVAQWWHEMTRYLSPEELLQVQVINYEKLAIKKYAEQLLIQDYCLVVADECQKIISPTAKSTKVFKKISTNFRLAMSGTPCPNAEWELWSVLDWLKPGVLGKNFYEFKAVYCHQHPVFHTILGLRNPQSFRIVVATLTHRVHKDEVLVDIPQRSTHTTILSLPPDYRKQYDEMREKMLAEVDGKKITITNALALISYLRKAVDCPTVVGIQHSSPKLNALYDILTEEKKPTLVFVEYKQSAHDIEYLLDCDDVHTWRVATVTSDTSLKERNEICKKFQAGELDVLIGTSALATGLNLQAAKRVIHFATPWNGARIDQRLARSVRHGQTDIVEEVFLECHNTIDTKISALIGKKRIMEGRFTKEELLNLLQ